MSMEWVLLLILYLLSLFSVFIFIHFLDGDVTKSWSMWHTHIKKYLSSQYLAVLQEFKLSQYSTSILYYQLFWAKNCSWVLTFRNGAKCLGYVAYKIWERDKSTLGVMGVKRKCQSVRWVGKLKHSVLHVWMSCKQVYVLCTKLLCKQFFLYY